MDVRLPNGTVIKGVPDGTPKEEVAQRAIAQGLATEADFPEMFQTQPRELTVGESVVGGLSGALTVGADTAGTVIGGLTGLVDLLNPFTDNDPAQIAENVRQKFQIEPTIGGQVALRDLGEALKPVEPLIQAATEFKEQAGDEALDLTGSPAFATFVNLIPDIALEIAGAGAGRRAAQTSLTRDVARRGADEAIGAVRAADEATGITRLTSDLFPPESRLGKLMQTQGELVAGFQRAGQQQARVDAVQKLANQFDAIDGIGFETKIVQGLKDSVEQSKNRIGRLYDASTKQLDTLGNVPLTKTKRFAQGIIDREVRKGALADQSVIDDMQTLIDAPDDLSFELVKEIRSGVGSKLEKVKRGAPVQGNSDTGLLKRVYGRISQDMEDFADQADPDLAKRWKDADSAVQEFATGTGKQGAKAIIKRGDATPEVVDQLLFSNKPSDIDFLAKNLTQPGKEAAKRRVVQRALQKSSIEGEDINPNKFLTQLNRFSTQTGKLFSKEERQAIEALKKQLKQTARAQDASVTTPTGQQLTLASAIAVPTALLPGVMQGIFESKPIRDLVVKRQGAKTARARQIIDDQLRSAINELGLGTGFAAVAASEEAQRGEDGDNNQ